LPISQVVDQTLPGETISGTLELTASAGHVALAVGAGSPTLSQVTVAHSVGVLMTAGSAASLSQVSVEGAEIDIRIDDDGVRGACPTITGASLTNNQLGMRLNYLASPVWTALAARESGAPLAGASCARTGARWTGGLRKRRWGLWLSGQCSGSVELEHCAGYSSLAR
jgi:hypothetical protein